MSTPIERLKFGLKYVMMPDPKNKATTMRWEEQVEKALARPVAEGRFKMLPIIFTYDPRINIKGIVTTRTATT